MLAPHHAQSKFKTKSEKSSSSPPGCASRRTSRNSRWLSGNAGDRRLRQVRDEVAQPPFYPVDCDKFEYPVAEKIKRRARRAPRCCGADSGSPGRRRSGRSGCAAPSPRCGPPGPGRRDDGRRWHSAVPGWPVVNPVPHGEIHAGMVFHGKHGGSAPPGPGRDRSMSVSGKARWRSRFITATLCIAAPAPWPDTSSM